MASDGWLLPLHGQHEANTSTMARYEKPGQRITDVCYRADRIRLMQPDRCQPAKKKSKWQHLGRFSGCTGAGPDAVITAGNRAIALLSSLSISSSLGTLDTSYWTSIFLFFFLYHYCDVPVQLSNYSPAITKVSQFATMVLLDLNQVTNVDIVLPFNTIIKSRYTLAVQPQEPKYTIQTLPLLPRKSEANQAPHPAYHVIFTMNMHDNRRQESRHCIPQ